MPEQDAITISIDVPMTLMRDAATQAVARAFYVDSSRWNNDRSGDGYKAIAAEVGKAIKAIDFAPLIAAALDEVLAPTVAEVLAEAVKAETKKQIKQIKGQA